MNEAAIDPFVSNLLPRCIVPVTEQLQPYLTAQGAREALPVKLANCSQATIEEAAGGQVRDHVVSSRLSDARGIELDLNGATAVGYCRRDYLKTLQHVG